MGEIINLADRRQEMQPHKAGMAVCLCCKHEWAAVAQVGWTHDDPFLECPSCTTHKGVFKFPAMTSEVWRCNCGCELFWHTPDGDLCPNCGNWVWDK